MRKSVVVLGFFCIYENKGNDQLLSNFSSFVFSSQTAQSLSFLIPKTLKLLAFICDSTSCVLWDLVRNPEDWFFNASDHLSRIVRKLDFFYFCLCENEGADQLRSNCEVYQRLCFRYTDSTISLLLKSKISSI